MCIKAVSLVMALMLIPILGAHAGLELSFSDTTPPSPLTDAVLPVGGAFTIDVIAKAPAGTIAAVDFAVTWIPSGNAEYLDVTAGNFLPGALVIEVDSGTPGAQSLAVTTSGGANSISSGVLIRLSFAKRTGEGSVRFGFSNISALNLSFGQVTPVTGISSQDITLPVKFSEMSADVTEAGVTIKWHTTYEMDNLGFNVFRSTSPEGSYAKLNRRLIEGQGTSAVPRDYEYIDSQVTEGETYYYKLEALDLSGGKIYSKVIRLEVHPDALRPPKRNELWQNYPNPGNPHTWLPYVLSSDGKVRIEIYNMAGQLIRTLELGSRRPGRYTSRNRAAYWDGRDSSGEQVPSGIYFYTLRAESFVATKKLIMLR
jgi:hypothetical protein